MPDLEDVKAPGEEGYSYPSAKNTFDAAVAPAVTNDIDEGYTIGSMWIDTVLENAYICTNNTDGAAVWKAIS